MFRKKKVSAPVVETKKDDSLPLPDVIYVTEERRYASFIPFINVLSVFNKLADAIQSKIDGRKIATYKLVEAKCYTLEPKEVPCDGSRN